MSGAVRNTGRQAPNRYLLKNGKWYVETREGVQGPFVRREEAAGHLERHKRRFGCKRGL